MRTYHLDAALKMPLYEQLYRAIRQDIMSGTVTSGERLPSKRRLAEHLKVSQITVETAYSQLLAEGYVVSKPRSGYYVQKFERITPTLSVPQSNIPEKQPEHKYRYDFKTNIVDTDCFPFATWARLLRGELTDKASLLWRQRHRRGYRHCVRRFAVIWRSFAVFLYSRNRSSWVQVRNICSIS